MERAPKEVVRNLYNKVANAYDLFHHIQTLWADSIHRRETVKYARIKPYDRVLDIGTGTGLTSLEICRNQPKAEIYSLDLSEKMLVKARKNLYSYSNVKFVHGDAGQMPFSDNKFDVIISAYGLGGVENIEKVMSEIIRVAKPQATVVLTEMVEPPEEAKMRRFLHKKLVEPWISIVWGFRDLDLRDLFIKNRIQIYEEKYFTNRLLGSTLLIKGFLPSK